MAEALALTPTRSSRALKTLLTGALLVGLGDAFDALVFYGLIRGGSPIRIFQSVASGLLGKAAYDGGFATFALGIAIHFTIALGVVAVYYLVSRRWKLLVEHPVACGMLYGVLVHLVMSFVVVPLSAIGVPRRSLASFINGVVGHALLVGLPAALVVRRGE